MPSRFVAVAFKTLEAGAVGRFWADVLGRDVVEEPGGVLLPGTQSQVGLRFLEAVVMAPERNRLHLHLTSGTTDDQRRKVERAVELGGRRRGTAPLPFGRDIYMADPGGHPFCVIEPGNAYLAGTGLLGEVTCDGTAAAGRFWLATLGWSLVWEKGEQIAIQSPAGGTKIAWDGTADSEAPGWNRQRFDLATEDLAAEVEQLVGRGATVVGSSVDAVVLTDPDGSEFTLTRESTA